MPDISFYAENVARYKPQITQQRGQIAVHTENMEYREQLTEYPIIPLLDRPKPVLDWVKGRAPIIPRVKLLGAFGVVDPSLAAQRYGARGAGGQYSVERRIPKPYPVKYTWPVGKAIEKLPSVASILHGPERTVIAQPLRDVVRKVEHARISVQT